MNTLLFIMGVFFIMCSCCEIWTPILIPMLFTKVYNGITDIDDPNYTGGVTYQFTPFMRNG